MSAWTLSGAPLGAGGEGLNLSVVLKLIRFVHNGVVLLLLSTVSRSGVQRGPPLWNPPVFHILTFLRPHVYMTRADRWRGAQPVLRLVMHFVLFFCFHNTRPEDPQSDVGAP